MKRALNPIHRVSRAPLSSLRRRRGRAGAALDAAFLLLAALAAPVHAQMPTDRPVVAQGTPAPGLDAFAGRRVAAVEIAGHNVTKDWVITREIRTKVSDSLDVAAVDEDVARLDNLSIFAEIRVDATAVGEDEVRLVFTFKEMPSWFPILSYVYRPRPVGLRARLLRRPRAAVEPDLLALDPGQPRLVRLLRRTLHASGRAARIRGDELRVHARGGDFHR